MLEFIRRFVPSGSLNINEAYICLRSCSFETRYMNAQVVGDSKEMLA